MKLKLKITELETLKFTLEEKEFENANQILDYIESIELSGEYLVKQYETKTLNRIWTREN